MFRLNVETEFWADPRYINLILLLKNKYEAIGMRVDIMLLAQKYWCPDKQPIPFDIWKTLKCPNELIEVGLVEERKNGYYVKGSEKHFDWWFKAKESGKQGGLKSAEKRQLWKGGQATLDQPLTDGQATVNQKQPSSSSS